MVPSCLKYTAVETVGKIIISCKPDQIYTFITRTPNMLDGLATGLEHVVHI